MSLKSEVSEDLKPGDDFFLFSNKRWLDSHPIPADKAQFGAMDVLSDENLAKLHDLLVAEIQGDEAFEIQLVKRYYQTAMDEATIAAQTPKTVKTIVDEIKALNDKSAVNAYITQQHAKGQELLWELIVEPDDKDSTHYLTRFWQGGLSLPERTYYLEDNEQFKAIRSQYNNYLVKFFELIGLDQAKQRAKHVFDLELTLAKASMNVVDCRDPQLVYNLYDPKKLTSDYPAIDWSSYLAGLGLSQDAKVNLSQPKFMAEINRLIAELPIEQWHDYLTIHSLIGLASRLSQPYEDLNFSFFGKVLNGSEQLEPRHVRITRQCMAVLPEPLGRLYVEHYFDESAKAAIGDLVEHLQAAFEVRLNQLDWMGDATKQAARHKLSTFLPLLGYPDKWKSYQGLSFGPEYARNFLATCQFEQTIQLHKIGQPVDREEWLMSPALVNAYYWPNSNGITFPAGILQPPFFDAKGDFAANYGAIGAVIGHELTHGFDDQGSQFDADGNLKTWWQKADQAAFDDRAKQLVEQYNQYELAGRHVDGELTLGENIADLGGLLVAFDAMQAKLVELGQRNEIDGFTPEQRFFLNYAVTWRHKTRDQLALSRLVADPHSPEVFRVNGVVINMDAFYGAFDVQPSDKLYLAPEKRVRIW